MAWLAALGGTGSAAAGAAGAAGAGAAGAAGASALSAVPAATSALSGVSSAGSGLSALSNATGSGFAQKLATASPIVAAGENASNQAAAAGAAETQRGMQFANAPSSTPIPTALSQFSAAPSNISSGTYDPMSLLERFRMYQGR